MSNRLLTPAEAAEHLSTTERHLADLRYHNRGPAYTKVGRLIRYAASDIRDYCESKRQVPAAA